VRRLLLDTHSFLWFVSGSAQLSLAARSAIEDPEAVVFLSAASAWEVAIKISLGKLTVHAPLADLFTDHVQGNNITWLTIDLPHILRVAMLPHHHRDPFDRLLIAQSLEEGLQLVSVDTTFDAYGITRLW
jgi:PIN domain nuclease of toxin-antitoxin system